jgi:hypothetical protein
MGKGKAADDMSNPISTPEPHGPVINLPECTCDRCNPDLYPNACHGQAENGDDIPWDPMQEDAPFRSEMYNITPVNDIPDVGRYESLTLTNAVINYLSQDAQAYTESQREAIQEFKEINEVKTAQEQTAISLAHLKYIVALFNEIFFWNSIRNIDIRFGEDKEHSIARTQYPIEARLEKAEGFFNELPIPTIIVNLADIEIDRLAYKLDIDGTPISKLHFVYSQLLHEMCHAFLFVYSCRGELHGEHIWMADSKCGNISVKDCTALAKDNHGISGHGRAWFRLTKFIEESSFRIIGINVRINGLFDLFNELAASDGWIPSDCDFDNFFPDADRTFLKAIYLPRVNPGDDRVRPLEKTLKAKDKKESDIEARAKFKWERSMAIYKHTQDLNNIVKDPAIFNKTQRIITTKQAEIKRLQGACEEERKAKMVEQALVKARTQKKGQNRNASLIEEWRLAEGLLDIRSDKAKLKRLLRSNAQSSESVSTAIDRVRTSRVVKDSSGRLSSTKNLNTPSPAKIQLKQAEVKSKDDMSRATNKANVTPSTSNNTSRTALKRISDAILNTV